MSRIGIARNRPLALLVAVVLVSALLPSASASAATVPMVAAGDAHTVGLKSDGTVVAAGYNLYGQCDVTEWVGIRAVAAGGNHTVGLYSDGTVVATGWDGDGQCGVADWTGIVAVAAGYYHTIGLRSDGSVVATGRNDYGQCDVTGWSDIIAIACGIAHTLGLQSDGTVVAAGYSDGGACDVTSWTDIVSVAAGGAHSLGLKSDGGVLAAGDDTYGQCDVTTWTAITGLAAGRHHTAGLRNDGTVVAVGLNTFSQCDTALLTGSVHVSAGGHYTLGLAPDGRVAAVGLNDYGQCDVASWNLLVDESVTGVSVSADAPAPSELSLTFSVTAGTAPDGGSVTDSAIDFGTLAANTPKSGSHRLDVVTNASNGYSVTAAEDAPLTFGTYTIPDATGDIGDITETVAGAWENVTVAGFGYTLANVTGSAAAFTSGYKQFADASAAELAQIVMGATAPTAGDAVGLSYKLNIGPTQVQGTYTNTVTYIATGNL